MKPFRNTGIEGGYASLDYQNYLLGLRRSINYRARVTGEKTSKWHSSRSTKEPASKSIVNPFPKGGVALKAKAALLQYEESPGKHGGRYVNANLLRAGLIQQTKKPTREGSDMVFGDEYKITEAGREYLAALKAPVVREQIR